MSVNVLDRRSISKPKISTLDRTQRAYYWVFVIAVVVNWSPNKLLPYIAPIGLLLFILFMSRKNAILRNIIFLSIVWAVWIGFSALLNPDFILQNALIAVVTYSAFYIPFVVPSRYLASDNLYIKMMQFLLFIVVLQAAIGFIQVAYGFSIKGSFDVSTGDFIEGTIGLALQQKRGFETPMFAGNMAFTLIALIPYILIYRKSWSVLVFLFGTAVLVFSSVMHILLFFLIALAVSFLVYRPIKLSSRVLVFTGIFTLILATFVAMMMFVLLPTNLTRISVQVDRVIHQENPKSILLSRLFTEVPEEYPQITFIGIGPGQFSSRASLIASGYYLGGLQNPKPVPFLNPTVSNALDEYVMDLWRSLINWPGTAGSTLRPFSSWLSVYSESGAIGSLVVSLIPHLRYSKHL